MNQTQERKNDQRNTGNQKDLEANTKAQEKLATKNSYQENTKLPKEKEL